MFWKMFKVINYLIIQVKLMKLLIETPNNIAVEHIPNEPQLDVVQCNYQLH